MFTLNQAPEPNGRKSTDNKPSRSATNGHRKSVQEVSKHKMGRAAKKSKWPKTDARHWQGRLFKNTFTRDGERQETADWCVKIGHKGRRETFNLATPNAEAAAGKALRIFRALIGAGWEAALAEHKPQAAAKEPKHATLGAWFEAVRTTAELRPATFNNYAQCLRQIASEIEDVGDQPAIAEDGTPKRDRKRRPILLSRFDYRTGGRAAWAAKVDVLPLSVLSAAAVQRWKLEYIGRAGNAPDARRRAENSAASLIRCARAVFREVSQIRGRRPHPSATAAVRGRGIAEERKHRLPKQDRRGEIDCDRAAETHGRAVQNLHARASLRTQETRDRPFDVGIG